MNWKDKEFTLPQVIGSDVGIGCGTAAIIVAEHHQIEGWLTMFVSFAVVSVLGFLFFGYATGRKYRKEGNAVKK